MFIVIHNYWDMALESPKYSIDNINKEPCFLIPTVLQYLFLILELPDQHLQLICQIGEHRSRR